MRLEDLPEMTLVILKHNPMYRRKFMRVNDIAEITVVNNSVKQNSRSRDYVKGLFYVIGRHRRGHLYVVKQTYIRVYSRKRITHKEKPNIDYHNIETIFSNDIVRYRSLLPKAQ